MMKIYAILITLASFAIALTSVASAEARDLAFLGTANSSTAWALDSGLDPTPLVGVLDPPYDIGNNQLSRIDLVSGQVDAVIELGDSGIALSFDLSPDGNSAIVTQVNEHALLWITGLGNPATATMLEIPLDHQPLSVAFSTDGRRAAIGYQTSGSAMVGLVDGLVDSPTDGEVIVRPAIPLEVEAGFLAAVEAIAFSRNGKRLITQTALHDSPPPAPDYFTPRVVLQSSQVIGNDIGAGLAHFLDPQPALPPMQPFQELSTGIALGDFAISCDGDRLIVPVSGALDLGQPDARIVILDGVLSNTLAISEVLSLADGVDISPFQIESTADCDRAVVTNVFTGTYSELSGIADGELTLLNTPLAMPFPSEPAVTADLNRLIVQHSRPPIDNVPPTSVTIYDFSTGQPTMAPVFGAVRSWIQVKDRTLATWPAGLTDRVATFGWPRWAERLMRRQLSHLTTGHGGDRLALRRLAFVSFLSHWLEYLQIADTVENELVQDYVDLASLIVLDRRSIRGSHHSDWSRVAPTGEIEEWLAAMGTD